MHLKYVDGVMISRQSNNKGVKRYVNESIQLNQKRKY